MRHVEEGYVEVDGQQVAFRRTARLPSVVFVHGIPTHKYLWRNVVGKLDQNDIGWVLFDLIGYGDSSKPVDIDLGVSSQSRFISAALSHIGWAGGTVVGHDIGGGVAQLLALDPSAGISRLVLVDSIAYDSFPEPGIARLKEPVWDSILGAEDFDLKKGLLKGLQKGIANKDKVTSELAAEYERPFAGVNGRLAYLRAARALNAADLVSRSTEIERLTIPTLLVWGVEDCFQPLQYGKKLADALPDAELKVIEDAGHFLPEDCPEMLGNLVVEFIWRT
ncbi:Putative hydrolases or acyltransferases (alpha/beta hydrolase superfamily) [Paraburkholderia caribensis MBA4]|uniref:Hydrolases or acyltransferases (Alpha/beta hydrolase superfamily) n=1 Tax=Paraburkholderia caribensis MBA4 TaxID=1323664 RepID=A0A0P0RIA0_9BURK|nr:alpha/beta hydrolase [Paraburkholderia caribensis]ALL68348.1 Putative hydrolases or acyltransferases (alpha/beta hydrolase superfamily) [Paraburkholderia caribensis MBA4]